jgi:hypothetical protein
VRADDSHIPFAVMRLFIVTGNFGQVQETRGTEDRVEYKIVRQGCRGYFWVPAAALSDVVKTAYAMSKKERGGS